MKWLRRVFLAILGLIGILSVVWWINDERRPEGTIGPEADALAHKLERAVDVDAFRRTQVLKWNHAQRHAILWDRGRNVARVTVDDWVALVHTTDFSGQAYEHGALVTEPGRKAQILDLGKRWFINDAYWLYPWLGLFDAGVTRSVVTTPEGTPGLLIQYSSGGVTPGDAYLWILDGDGRPIVWKMWVSVLPIGGIRFSWDGWVKLPTGAQVATVHKFVGLTFEVEDLAAADDVAAIEPGPDPFLPLFSE